MNNVAGMPALALILPAFYWLYPRQPRSTRRRGFDALTLLLAFAGCLASLHWSFGFADRGHGHLWPQILATSVGYGVFLAVLSAAFFIRRRMFAKL